MRRLLAAVAAALLLAGCASPSPQARLQERANAVVEAANAGNAAALRTAADLFLQEVRQQEAQADLNAGTARDLGVLITRILANAELLDQAEPLVSLTPTPAPSSSEPSPSPSATPSATPPPPSASATPSEAPPSSEPPSAVPSVIIGSTSPQPSPSQS